MSSRTSNWTVSNALSLLRLPLAFLFLDTSIAVRVTSLLLAMISDGLDGFIARRSRTVTQLGAFLDPLTDKFYVLFVGAVLVSEGAFNTYELLALISRDFSVAIFGLILMFTGTLGKLHFQSIWSGKATTFFQFILLMSFALGKQLPAWSFQLFPFLAMLALIELFILHRYALQARSSV